MRKTMEALHTNQPAAKPNGLASGDWELEHTTLFEKVGAMARQLTGFSRFADKHLGVIFSGIVLVVGLIAGMWVQGVRASYQIDALKEDNEWNKAEIKKLQESNARLSASVEFGQQLEKMNKNQEESNKVMRDLVDALKSRR